MGKHLPTTILYLAISLLQIIIPTEYGTVTVEVKNLRSDKGYVLISLYDNSDDFPENASKASGKARVKIKDGVATVTFGNLKPGDYAIAILHDENNNLKMDFNIIGIPKEGYGFSNDAKGTLGPPSFKKASFELKSGEKRLLIRTNYFL